jgi:hypothetical protein
MLEEKKIIFFFPAFVVNKVELADLRTSSKMKFFADFQKPICRTSSILEGRLFVFEENRHV